MGFWWTQCPSPVTPWSSRCCNSLSWEVKHCAVRQAIGTPSYIAHVDPCCIIDVWMYHSSWLVFHIVAWFLLISGLVLHFQMNKYRGLFCISMNRRVLNWAALGKWNQVWRLQTWHLQHDDGDGQVDHNDDDKMEPASLGKLLKGANTYCGQHRPSCAKPSRPYTVSG